MVSERWAFMNNNSGANVNDEELNEMIANLSAGAATPAGVPVVSAQPAVSSENSVMPVLQPLPTTQPQAQAVKTIPTPVQVSSPTPIVDDTITNDAPVAFAAPTTSESGDGLDAIKGQALTELRPLVDRLNISPEDKFDILLLMIRSTDDKTLIPEAHEIAKNITDESRKAQALLDIIKEIDFFDQNK